MFFTLELQKNYLIFLRFLWKGTRTVQEQLAFNVCSWYIYLNTPHIIQTNMGFDLHRWAIWHILHIWTYLQDRKKKIKLIMIHLFVHSTIVRVWTMKDTEHVTSHWPTVYLDRNTEAKELLNHLTINTIAVVAVNAKHWSVVHIQLVKWEITIFRGWEIIWNIHRENEILKRRKLKKQDRQLTEFKATPSCQ